MGGCRFRYEDLPEQLRRQVDAALSGTSAKTRNEESAGVSRTVEPTVRRKRDPNKTEAAYCTDILDVRTDVAAIHYEGLTFRMANGHRYTPDWLVVTDAGRIECHEIKGRRALHSQQRARLAFDQARVEFPWIVWIWATRLEQGWATEGATS